MRSVDGHSFVGTLQHHRSGVTYSWTSPQDRYAGLLQRFTCGRVTGIV